MQSRTSFFCFVRELVLRHAQSGRQIFAIHPGLLLDHPAVLVVRALGRVAHIRCPQFFCRDDSARLHHNRRFLMQKFAAQVADTLVQLRYLRAQPR